MQVFLNFLSISRKRNARASSPGVASRKAHRVFDNITGRSDQHGRYFADDIFSVQFLQEKHCILIKKKITGPCFYGPN